MSPDTLIALGALLVATLSALGTLHLSRRQAKLEGELGRFQLKELKARDADRARARIVCRFRRIDDRLIITNAGGGQARDVDVRLDCPDGRSAFPGKQYERLFPIAVLEPGVEALAIVVFTSGCCPPLDAVVRWLDPDGTQREEQMLVTDL